MIEYEIRTAPAIRQPTAGAFYTDDDGDLFLYIGESPRPWLEMSAEGTYRRDADYPVSPLTELTPVETAAAIDKKIRTYLT